METDAKDPAAHIILSSQKIHKIMGCILDFAGYNKTFHHRLCHGCQVHFVNSEFTQQDGRRKKMAKCLRVTNVTGCYSRYKFVRNFLNTDVLCSSTKRSVFGNAKFGGRLFQTKSLSCLSHKV